MPDPLDALRGVTFKVASRCNLNCSYCYVFNKGDTTWRDRPARMSQEVFEAGIARLRDACVRTGREHVGVTLHGGEPTLIGPRRARAFFEAARDGLAGVADVRLAIQTNGTRLNREWVELFDEHRVDVGVSMDGPAAVHDRQRVDHRGRGSHRAVRRGLDLLREGGVPFALLSVVNFDADPLEVHEEFCEIGPDRISYLMPHLTHDDMRAVHARHGATPCADWLAPVLDHWWRHGTLRAPVQPFASMARLVLGGPSDLDQFGGAPLGFCFVETDGEIEGLDVLKICEDGFAATGHNVLTEGFDAFAAGGGLLSEMVFGGRPLPTGCAGCAEADTCGGGYVPHRYLRGAGLDRPSVWCRDLLGLFSHVRRLLQVEPSQTHERRRGLAELAAAGRRAGARPAG
ncbi:MAG: radical SAM protein [Solirubrobacteraceae bacterium]